MRRAWKWLGRLMAVVLALLVAVLFFRPMCALYAYFRSLPVKPRGQG